MAKYTGSVKVVLIYTIHDLEVDATDEDDAEMRLVGLAEAYDSEEILNLGEWILEATDVEEVEE